MVVLFYFGDLHCPRSCRKSTGMSSGSSLSQSAHFSVLICKIWKVIPSLSPSCFFFFWGSNTNIWEKYKVVVISRGLTNLCVSLNCVKLLFWLFLYIFHSCPVGINSQELMVLQCFKLYSFMCTSLLYLQIHSAKPCAGFFPCVVEGKLDWKLGDRGSGPRYESIYSPLVKLG